MWWWESQHQVFVGRPFAIGGFAITVDQFGGFVKETSYRFGTQCQRSQNAYSGPERTDLSYLSPGFDQSDSHPVVCVSFEDAKAYVSWLSGKAGKSYRLPSEAEREYVTRAGTATPFRWGATIATNRANYNGTSYDKGPPGEFRRKTVP